MQYGPDKVRQVYDLKAQGLSTYKVQKITGLSPYTIKNWMAKPEKFSPFIDEIALERALGGDKKVFQNLSYAEVREFWKRFKVIYKKEQAWANTLVGPDKEPKYMAFMSECLGITEAGLKSGMERKYADRY